MKMQEIRLVEHQEVPNSESGTEEPSVSSCPSIHHSTMPLTLELGTGLDLTELTFKPDLEEATQHDDVGPQRVTGTELKEFMLTEPISAVA